MTEIMIMIDEKKRIEWKIIEQNRIERNIRSDFQQPKKSCLEKVFVVRTEESAW